MIIKTYLIAFVMLVCALVALPSTSRAQEKLDYIDPLTVGRILQSMRLSYQTQFDGANKPKLVITDKNLRSEQFEVYFFNCKDGTECESITLWSWYHPTTPQNYFKSNSWNKKNRFVKAYLDDEYQPVMEMDINAQGGINRRNLEILIRAYVTTMDGYADFMTVAKKKK